MANAISEQVNFDPNIEPVNPESVHKLRLSGGDMMPAAAFGTFHSDWAKEYMKDATVEAIRLGWRHLDTARAYENEQDVGRAIQEAIDRGYINSADDLFITGKGKNRDNGFHIKTQVSLVGLRNVQGIAFIRGKDGYDNRKDPEKIAGHKFNKIYFHNL